MSAATIEKPTTKPDIEAYGHEQIAAAGDDPGKLRSLAERMLKRLVEMGKAEAAALREAEEARTDAREWEEHATHSATEAEDALFRQDAISRAGDLIHAGHDRFPWRMCREEPCVLLQEATGRNTSTD